MKPRERILSFDYGSVRIGIAVGNSKTGTAEPLTVLDSAQQSPDWPAIDAIVDQWKPDTLLVGLPLSLSGEETAMSNKARDFARRLGKRSGLEVRLIDERYSTREAFDIVAAQVESGIRKRKQSIKTDDVAAQLILETYLSEMTNRALTSHG